MINISPLSVHVSNNYLAAIISLKDVNNIIGVLVTMYTLIAKAVHVIMSDGTAFKFKECGSRLYYYDIEITD